MLHNSFDEIYQFMLGSVLAKMHLSSGEEVAIRIDTVTQYNFYFTARVPEGYARMSDTSIVAIPYSAIVCIEY